MALEILESRSVCRSTVEVWSVRTMSQPGSDVVIRDTRSQVAMKQRLGVIE